MKKRISYRFGVKIAAWIMLAVFALVFFLSIAGVAVLVHTGAYWDGGRNFREAAAEQVFSFDRVRIRYILREYLSDGDIDDTEYREMYKKSESNVFFTIYDSKGNIVVDYGAEDAYRISYKYEEFYRSDENEITETKRFESFEESQRYITELEKNNYISETYWMRDGEGESGELTVTYCDKGSITYTVNAYIRKSFSARDRYFYTLRAVDFVVGIRYWIILAVVACAAICLLMIIFLCTSAGRTTSGEIRLSVINRIPLDLFWAICIVCALAFLFFLQELSVGDEYEWFTVAMFVMISTVCSLLLSASIVTLAARIKRGGWYKNTVIYRALVLLKKFALFILRGIKFLIRSIPLFGQALALFIMLRTVEFVCFVWDIQIYALFWLFEGVLLVALLIYVVIALRKLQRAAKEMAEGKLDYRAELSFMPRSLREHGENLSNIGEGMKTALAEKIKSEHMKAELITNVSHDIKTPLTSIVNYVDLLKKEGLTSESAPEYLEVLERQSAKLKKLTEDLIEASKATTGCISVNADEMDINVLLEQACGEYEGKLAQRNLTPVMTLAAENPIIVADGGLVWRVFDNLFNNICKYSQEGTRVYLKTEMRGENVHITFSNISAAQLDVSSDELMERFVRGDASRNTEGSGLGLSIARSLTELQNGSFDIKIDGDLFKVEMVFGAKVPENDCVKNN